MPNKFVVVGFDDSHDGQGGGSRKAGGGISVKGQRGVVVYYFDDSHNQQGGVVIVDPNIKLSRSQFIKDKMTTEQLNNTIIQHIANSLISDHGIATTAIVKRTPYTVSIAGQSITLTNQEMEKARFFLQSKIDNQIFGATALNALKSSDPGWR